MQDVHETKFKVALLPGDGIGPEVTAAAVRVLNEASSNCGFDLAYEEFSVGAGEYLRSGDPLPQSVFSRFAEFDAILLGAMGLPGIRWPSGIEMTPQIDIREQLDLYCGLRPIHLFHSDDSPLRDKAAGSIDLMLVRESTEGLFASRKVPPDPRAEQVEDLMRITRKGAERVIRASFQQAMKRRKYLALADKANVLPSMAFFRQIFDEIAPEFPEVKTDRLYVDAVALFLVQHPERFDVLLAENMFGDILSDLLAGLVGGMGMAPSADIGEKHAVFQPSHGSAPDIAGKGVANPVATILSAAMMLEWLGGDACKKGAELIQGAVVNVFSTTSVRTRDMKGTATTGEMTDAILQSMRQNANGR